MSGFVAVAINHRNESGEQVGSGGDQAGVCKGFNLVTGFVPSRNGCNHRRKKSL
jgi:hypothetical protein